MEDSRLSTSGPLSKELMNASFEVNRWSEEGRGRIEADPKEPMVFAEWFEPLFFHYRIDPNIPRALVPAPFTVETFDGSGWVTLVAITMRRFRKTPQGKWMKHLFPLVRE